MVRYIISQIKRRPHIYFSVVCSITVLCGYLFTYLQSSISISRALLVLFCLSSIIWGYLLIKYFVKMLKIRFGTKKSGVLDIQAPEFEKLAEEMKIKLNKTRPFVLQKNLDNAYYNPQEARVVFGDVLFNRLTPPERLATLSHEFAHIKRHHYFKLFSLLPLSLVLTMATLPTEPSYIFAITSIALILAIFPYISRKFEYEADAESANRTSINTTISSLQKAERIHRWDRETVTHPSTNRRIERLRRRQHRAQDS
jgi:Zn-dependent protease with chaperone function